MLPERDMDTGRVGRLCRGPGMGVAIIGGSELLVNAGLNTSVPNRARRDGCIPWKDWGRMGIDGVDCDEQDPR